MSENQNTTREEQLEFLQDMIRIPSIKATPDPGAPFGEETHRALLRFLEQARQDGFRTKDVDGYVGWLEFGDENLAGMIAAVGHLDVVPVGEWTDAFEPKIEGDKLIGRGSIDDKGPVVAAYYAIKELKDSGYRPKHRLRLILGLDEESGSQCLKRYRETEDIPVAAFTPDADFPVIHAEKGMLHFDITMDFPKQESGKLRLVKANAGSRANVIPGFANITFADENGNTTVETVEGVMGHASMPALAKNAISVAMEQVYERLAASGAEHPFVTMYHELIGMDYDGDKLGIKCEDEVSGPLTFNVGVIDLDETHASLTCDIRYPVTENQDRLVDTIREKVTGYGAHFELTSSSAPLYLPKDDKLVATLTKVYNDLTGYNAEPVAIGGGTYARSLPNTVAFGPCFPGDEGLAHQNGEYISIRSFFRSQEVYREALRQLDQEYA